MTPLPPRSTLFPYTTLFRSLHRACQRQPTTSGLPHPSPTKMESAFDSQTECFRFEPTKPYRPCCRGPVQSRFAARRSEEHTSELQSHVNLVCRLLLEKKNHT